MSQAELQESIRTTNIFARVVPEQKLAIVNALATTVFFSVIAQTPMPIWTKPNITVDQREIDS